MKHSTVFCWIHASKLGRTITIVFSKEKNRIGDSQGRFACVLQQTIKSCFISVGWQIPGFIHTTQDECVHGDLLLAQASTSHSLTYNIIILTDWELTMLTKQLFKYKCLKYDSFLYEFNTFVIFSEKYWAVLRHFFALCCIWVAFLRQNNHYYIILLSYSSPSRQLCPALGLWMYKNDQHMNNWLHFLSEFN